MNPNNQPVYTVPPNALLPQAPPQYQAQPPMIMQKAPNAVLPQAPPQYQAQPPMLMQKQPTKSSKPAHVTCQFCNQNVITNTRATPGLITYIACGFTILLGCWLGCCLIPFCVDELQDTVHSCPNCKNQIDVYKPS